MTVAMRTLADGDTAVPVPDRARKDEIGQLAGAFNKMGERLENQREELDRLQQIVEEQLRALEILAITDPLTGLHNRRHFDRQAKLLFEQANRYDQPFAVMLGDIDHFKQINDRFSHAIGDLVLERVGGLLQRAVRTSDVLARYGGEEFVIAFANSAKSEAAQLCERLRQSIQRADWSDLHPDLTVTISIGIAYDTRLGSLEAMLQQADARLYQAKRDGRNQVCAEITESAAS
jgi:diguanylate cyclase (GGDEF)-like protein